MIDNNNNNKMVESMDLMELMELVLRKAGGKVMVKNAHIRIGI